MLLLCGAALLTASQAHAIGVDATDHVSQGAINGNGAAAASFFGASNDGSRVFFSSIEPLASTDGDTVADIYMREGNTTSHLSQGAINGSGAFGASFAGASSDGSRVFFHSAEQLASTDADSASDIYMREGSTTTHISQGAINGNGAFDPGLADASNDGSRVIFISLEQLASTDTDGALDVYMREGSTTTHVSQGAINGNGAFGLSSARASDDGSRVFFFTAEQLASTDTDASQDIYMREGSTTTHVSQGAINGNGAFLASIADISDDGSRIFFLSFEALASTDTDTSIDLYMREGNTTTHLSQGAINGNGADTVVFAATSNDGSRVFFSSHEPLASTDADSVSDIYMREGNTTTHVSRGAINGNGAQFANFSAASSDGSRVVFTSTEPLASTDRDAATDVYMREGTTTTHISRGEINGNGAEAANVANVGGVSTDGSRVFFHSDEQLVSTDNDARRDIYTRGADATKLVSQGAINGSGNHDVSMTGASTDGSRVFFHSNEQLAATDTDAHQDLFAATIDSASPQTSIDSGPADGSTTGDMTPTFAFSSDDPPSSFQCRLYSTGTSAPAFAACSGSGDAHTPAASLADGNLTFEVAATDQHGNTDPTPASRSFTIDTTPPSSTTPPDVLNPETEGEGSSTPPADTTPPSLEADAKKSQRLGKSVAASVGCDEPCAVVAAGTVSVPGGGRASRALAAKATTLKLRSASAQLSAGETAKLKLKIPRKTATAIAKVLDAGGKAKAKLTITATDAAGNSSRAQLSVRIKR